jgi:hypothetical protein
MIAYDCLGPRQIRELLRILYVEDAYRFRYDWTPPSKAPSAYGTQWRQIPSIENYEVSDLGFIRDRGSRRLKPVYTDSSGYRLVGVRQQDRGTSKMVHCLVMEAFHPQPAPGLEIRHLDGNPANNALANLAWGTAKQNAQDKARYGKAPWQKSRRGEIKNAKMTPEQVREMRALYAAGGVSQRKLAVRYGLAYSNVARILNRTSWAWVPEGESDDDKTGVPGQGVPSGSEPQVLPSAGTGGGDQH